MKHIGNTTLTRNKLDYNSRVTFFSKVKRTLFKIGKQFVEYFTKSNSYIEIICSLLVILFVYTGLNKLLDYETFKFQLGRSPFVKEFASIIAILLPVGELLISLALIFRRTRILGLYLSLFIMLLFTGYIYGMQHFSYYLPCSCGGILETLTWNEHLVVNIFFAVISAAGIILHKKQAMKRDNKA